MDCLLMRDPDLEPLISKRNMHKKIGKIFWKRICVKRLLTSQVDTLESFPCDSLNNCYKKKLDHLNDVQLVTSQWD